MSLNLFMFFVFTFIGGSILSAIVEGYTGLATTEVSSQLSETGATLTVGSTAGFSSNGVVSIGDETICYTGTTATTFTGLSRGSSCRSHSSAAVHAVGSRIYSEAPGVINTLVGFDMASAFSDGGFGGFAKGIYTSFKNLPNFLQAMASMIMWDYSFLVGPYVYIKYFMYVFSAGMVLAGVKMALGR
jgi:hypothetical protein